MAKSITTWQKELKALRKKVDAADRALIRAFHLRFNAVERVGAIKRELGLPIYQKARWAEVVEDRVKQAKKARVDEAFIRNILKQIHREAIRIQKRKT